MEEDTEDSESEKEDGHKTKLKVWFNNIDHQYVFWVELLRIVTKDICRIMGIWKFLIILIGFESIFL